jgi:hypothetical protein
MTITSPLSKYCRDRLVELPGFQPKWMGTDDWESSRELGYGQRLATAILDSSCCLSQGETRHTFTPSGGVRDTALV